jgi:mono/diheme cytochrome c family protein
MKATGERSGRQYLAGAEIDNWYASPLSGDRKTGLYAWSGDEIVEYLETGHTARVAASGVMAEVIAKSTQYLTDGDLSAIAEYLKSLPPSNRRGHGDAGPGMQANAAGASTHTLNTYDTAMRGSRGYLDNCSACHGSDGSGVIRTFPSLLENECVNARNPITLIHLVLDGSSMPSTQKAPSSFAMPDFGWRLGDAEVAEVLSYVRGSWGNHANTVGHRKVGRIRKILIVKKTE